MEWDRPDNNKALIEIEKNDWGVQVQCSDCGRIFATTSGEHGSLLFGYDLSCCGKIRMSEGIPIIY